MTTMDMLSVYRLEAKCLCGGAYSIDVKNVSFTFFNVFLLNVFYLIKRALKIPSKAS